MTDLTRNSRKTVLITGCSPGGIGNALAREFHSKGLHVFATARQRDVLEDLATLGITTMSLDVNSIEDIKRVKAAIVKETGGTLSILVNNAGRAYSLPAMDLDFDQVLLTFQTNLFSAMRMCQEFGPLLIKAEGQIINVGSVAGTFPYPWGSAYSATKAGLHAYSDTLRVELAPFNVGVTVIISGGVSTNIERKIATLPEGSIYSSIRHLIDSFAHGHNERSGPAKDYASAVVSKALQRSPPKWLWTGTFALPFWFATSFLPKGIWDWVAPKINGINALNKEAALASLNSR